MHVNLANILDNLSLTKGLNHHKFKSWFTQIFLFNCTHEFTAFKEFLKSLRQKVLTDLTISVPS